MYKNESKRADIADLKDNSVQKFFNSSYGSIYASCTSGNISSVAPDIANISAPSATQMPGAINISTTPNEIITDFGQGGIGDCWYLASLKSLSISALGQQIFNNVINIGTTSATVIFKGAPNFTYNTTLANLTAEVNDGDWNHSRGDADALLLEMALISYTGNASAKNSVFYSSPYNGGWMNQALSLITGKVSSTFNNWYNDLAATTTKLNELAKIIDHTAITAACMNQSNASLDIVASSHAYSIVAIDSVNKTVSFRNPWYSSKVLKTLTYAQFSQYFQRIDYVDLSSNNQYLMAGNTGCSLTSGTGADMLYGGTGNDTINGGTGADTMYGGIGNDIYYVDNTVDRVYEYSGQGTDTVYSSASYYIYPNIENLTLTGSANINGDGNELNNIINGNSGKNNLTGGAGNDTLNGGVGADSMLGGLGNDTYYVDNIGDRVLENAGTGTDSVISSITYTLENNIENLTLSGTSAINATGNSLNNSITGNSANNTLNGGTGADTMAGGAGNDTYYVDSSYDVIYENASAGTDTIISTISYALGSNLENLTLSGSYSINGYGNSLNNSIAGNSGSNYLYAYAGNDTLNGGAGIDRMYGGVGNDTYYVDNTGDVITENYNEGTDTVVSYISYTLGNNLENLTLGGTSAINGIGNSLNNSIKGNSANNILNCGTGADWMSGETGDDTYYVDNTGDVVVENLNAGTDAVNSTISYTLGSNLENLTLTGTYAINGYGNSLNNVIVGNSGSNYLYGYAGNDYLNGWTGTDRMYGGVGNDTYYVDNTGDVVTENYNEGTDTVISSVFYTLGNNIENLILTGTSAINGYGDCYNNAITGNSTNNMLYGYSGNDILDGGTGADTLTGGIGNDLYYLDSYSDIIYENYNEGIDTVISSICYTLGNNLENLTLAGLDDISGTGNSLNNIIIGNRGNNIINGGLGVDTMAGGTENDTYYVDNINDVIIENQNEGIDKVISSISYTLVDNNLENLTLTGTSTINGTGNSLTNIITGNSANNVLYGYGGRDSLIGGAGADTMYGGTGNDYYYIDDINDVVIENSNEGVDIINSLVSYTLSNNTEEIVLEGTSNINGTGNSLNNIIAGNDGNNIITGGKGYDSLYGCKGHDTYCFNAGDSIDMLCDITETNTIKFGSSVLKQTIGFFLQGIDLIIGYSSGDRITIDQQINSYNVNSIDDFILSDGNHLTYNDINVVIQQMSSFASSHGIQMSSIDNVLANQSLMNIVSNAWHS